MANNEKKFKFSRVYEAAVAFKDVKGQYEVGVAILDRFSQNTDKGKEYHGEMGDAVIGLVEGIIQEKNSDISFKRYMVKSTSELERLCQLGLIHIVSISMTWTGSVSSINALSKKYGVFIIASAGNRGTKQKLYPASGDDCWSDGACEYNEYAESDIYFPSPMGYVQENERVDGCTFTNIDVEGIGLDGKPFKGTFGGTSCDCKYTTALACIIFIWYFITFNRRTPKYNEINTYMVNACQDVLYKGQVGRDDKTGWGHLRLPSGSFLSEFHWSSWARSYMVDKLGYRFDKLQEPEELATRENVFFHFAYIMGWRPTSYWSPSKAVEYLNTLGCDIKGRPDGNGDTDMAFKKPITRNEVHKIQAECIEANLQQQYFDKLIKTYEPIRPQSDKETWTEYGVYLMEYCERNGNMLIYNKEIGSDYIQSGSLTTLVVRQAGYQEFNDNNYYD